MDVGAVGQMKRLVRSDLHRTLPCRRRGG
jgi:hypothetical protein